jgi:hypothetical protein
VAFTVPDADSLGATDRLQLFGRICDGSAPSFDPGSGMPSCSDGQAGTTAAVTVLLQRGEQANENPVADRAFALDGQPWPATAAGDDPCATGPTVAAGTSKHVVGATTEGTDRETFTAMVGDPPVPTASRESLQISELATAGELDSPFAFVEGSDPAPETTVDVKWNAPKPADVPTTGLPVTFTFVVRDGRGGIDWTTRAACVTP